MKQTIMTVLLILGFSSISPADYQDEIGALRTRLRQCPGDCERNRFVGLVSCYFKALVSG